MLNTLSVISLVATLNTHTFSSVIANYPRYLAYAESKQVKDMNETNKIFLVKNKQEIVLDVPYVNQKENLKGTPDEWAGGSACGPAAITMALLFHNEDITLYDVVNALPPSVYVKGKMFYDLTSGPSYFGYKSTQININTEEIYKALEQGHPILMDVQNYDGITGHEIVVVGIKEYNSETKTAKSLIVHDPFRESYREFEYINEKTLEQPEGYVLPIGHIKPFYITKDISNLDS